MDYFLIKHTHMSAAGLSQVLCCLRMAISIAAHNVPFVSTVIIELPLQRYFALETSQVSTRLAILSSGNMEIGRQ
ncbi:hypothetical protein [Halomonas caseinilytica]|uniref:hypothetical protein n=1 Tax=Halomonas caseinilytica TaxID=438744 RepID=UPI0010BF1D30|nr:hypothetical protein [Halomonas caseinilytica]